MPPPLRVAVCRIMPAAWLNTKRGQRARKGQVNWLGIQGKAETLAFRLRITNTTNTVELSLTALRGEPRKAPQQRHEVARNGETHRKHSQATSAKWDKSKTLTFLCFFKKLLLLLCLLLLIENFLGGS